MSMTLSINICREQEREANFWTFLRSHRVFTARRHYAVRCNSYSRELIVKSLHVCLSVTR